MIIDRPESHFIFVLPYEHTELGYNYINVRGRPVSNKQYLESWGKWIVFGKRAELDELARKIDPYVESKRIPAAKYDRARIDEFDIDRCVMCVYCHFDERDGVWEILQSVGVCDKAWVFERETVERWLPGGANLEKWIEGRNLGPEEAERVRQDAVRRLSPLFEDEDAVFRGIEQ